MYNGNLYTCKFLSHFSKSTLLMSAPNFSKYVEDYDDPHYYEKLNRLQNKCEFMIELLKRKNK